jgi:hypothetical protein
MRQSLYLSIVEVFYDVLILFRVLWDWAPDSLLLLHMYSRTQACTPTIAQPKEKVTIRRPMPMSSLNITTEMEFTKVFLTKVYGF